MKDLIRLLLISALLLGYLLAGCCRQPQKKVFYYRNGYTIKDSAQLYYLNRQLPKLLSKKELLEPELHIHTYLESGTVNMQHISASLESTYRDHLRWTYSQYAPPNMDSLCEADQLFHIGIIALENKTGKIVFTQTNRKGGTRYSIFEDYTESQAHAVFSFALAMKKHQPHDSYIDANGEESLFTFYHAYAQRQWTFSLAQNNNFSGEEANEIVKELLPERRTKKRYGHTPYLFEEQLKLIEIAQIWSLLQQEGIYRKPAVIRSIKNASGIPLYKHLQQPKRTLDRTTALRMLQLADFRRKTNIYVNAVEPRKNRKNYFINSYGNGTSFGGTSLFVTPEYTFVVVCRTPGFSAHHLSLSKRDLTGYIFPHIHELLYRGKQASIMPDYVNITFLQSQREELIEL